MCLDTGKRRIHRPPTFTLGNPAYVRGSLLFEERSRNILEALRYVYFWLKLVKYRVGAAWLVEHGLVCYRPTPRGRMRMPCQGRIQLNSGTSLPPFNEWQPHLGVLLCP